MKFASSGMTSPAGAKVALSQFRKYGFPRQITSVMYRFLRRKSRIVVLYVPDQDR
jgi:hypothetical protein